MELNEFACRLLPLAQLPTEPGWLSRQPGPVIGIGAGAGEQADVVVADARAAASLQAAAAAQPLAALVLVQVLRAVEQLPLADALALESLAYGVLQAGAGFRQWLATRDGSPALVSGGSGPPVAMRRDGDTVIARLNRPGTRNAMTVEMRDALVELFELVAADPAIERLELSGAGACFSVGGELREFGLAADVATAHAVRTLRHPGRLLAAVAARVHCHLHGACIGSGIELPAFAGRVTAARRTFFQLPEVGMGLIPGAGGCVSVSRRIGRQRTAWLALSGRRINAQTALDWGLVDALAD